MKIQSLLLITLLCIFSNGVWAQPSESAMQFEGIFADWGITYKGKRYLGISKKPEAIANQCNCNEAAFLFKSARRQYINGLITLTITMPIGLIGGTQGMVYSLIELDSTPLAFVSITGGAIVGSSGFWVIRKSNKNGRSAVFEFNKCMESKSAKQ